MWAGPTTTTTVSGKLKRLCGGGDCGGLHGGVATCEWEQKQVKQEKLKHGSLESACIINALSSLSNEGQEILVMKWEK